MDNDDLLLTLKRRGFDVEQHAMEAYLSKTYDKLEKLGEGNSGSVWKVLQKRSGECYAMKMIKKKKGVVSERGLETEIKCLRKLQHRHIVNIVDSVESSSHLWIIMEYAEGGGLYERIVESQHFSERSAARVVKQVLKAVHYMHSYGVVHRDLKPENILLMTAAQESDVKVADFGLAVILDNGLQGYRIDESMRMKAASGIRDAFCGTPISMAPEVAKCNAAYGPQCDIWSVGCITYELLSGTPPFNAITAAELFRMLQVVIGPSFNDLIWLEISSNAKDLVGKMLRPNPEDRISAREALDHTWFRTAPDRHNAEAHGNLIRRVTRDSVASYATTNTQMHASRLHSRMPSRASTLHKHPCLSSHISFSSQISRGARSHATSEATRCNAISIDDDTKSEVTLRSISTHSTQRCDCPSPRESTSEDRRTAAYGGEMPRDGTRVHWMNNDDADEKMRTFRITRGGLQRAAWSGESAADSRDSRI